MEMNWLEDMLITQTQVCVLALAQEEKNACPAYLRYVCFYCVCVCKGGKRSEKENRTQKICKSEDKDEPLFSLASQGY